MVKSKRNAARVVEVDPQQISTRLGNENANNNAAGMTTIQRKTKTARMVKVDPVLAELIPGFIASVNDDVNSIRSALDRGDFDTIGRIAHNIKGAGGGYGFHVISDIGAVVNRAAKQGDVSRISMQIEQLSTYLSQVEVVYE